MLFQIDKKKKKERKKKHDTRVKKILHKKTALSHEIDGGPEEEEWFRCKGLAGNSLWESERERRGGGRSVCSEISR